jgi:hypothetical protein
MKSVRGRTVRATFRIIPKSFELKRLTFPRCEPSSSMKTGIPIMIRIALRTFFEVLIVLSLLVLGMAGQDSIAMAQSVGTFSATGNMTVSRSEHTAVLLRDGRVLLTGGRLLNVLPGGDVDLASAEVYDPSSGTFTATGSMSTPRTFHSATLLPDGRVLITGGYDANNNEQSSAELFDPASNTFAPTANMMNSRAGHSAVLLPSGKVLVVGGFATSSATSLPAELFDPASNMFTATGFYMAAGEIVCDVLSPPAVSLADGRVFSLQDGLAQIYSPMTGAFSPSATGLDGSNCPSTATLLPNGKIVLTGGALDDSFDRSSHAETYDPQTGLFAATPDMAFHRSWHTATSLPDGTVLVAGGETENCSADSCGFAGTLATAELYDPSKGAFAPTGGMTARREGHTATLLKDGGVLIAGGVSYGGIGGFLGTDGTAEIYCPANATCSPDPFQQAVAAMKTAAGTDSLNFYQWAWYWQTLPPFSGAPAGFGVAGSISPDGFQSIVAAGGGDPLPNITAEQWASYFRQMVP